MIEADVSDARNRLEELLSTAAAGEDIVITRHGSPVARLTAIKPPRKSGRVPGSARGQIRIPDDFDDPVPEEIEAAFKGRDEAWIIKALAPLDTNAAVWHCIDSGYIKCR